MERGKVFDYTLELLHMKEIYVQKIVIPSNINVALDNKIEDYEFMELNMNNYYENNYPNIFLTMYKKTCIVVFMRTDIKEV